MDTSLSTANVSASGAVVVGLAGMWINSKRMDDMRQDIRDLRLELAAFKEVVNSKFAALDLEIAKLMDKRP